MVDNKTLIVVGAGASYEADLPTGQDLKHQIASILDFKASTFDTTGGDPLVSDSLRYASAKNEYGLIDFNSYLRACWSIRDAMPQAKSIDDFIDDRKDEKEIEFCAKLAIVRSVLMAEKGSKLYVDLSNVFNKLDFKALEVTWFNSLFQLLFKNCSCNVNKIRERMESVVFIVFNYDRCIENFLYNSLQNYYGFNSNEASGLVNKMEIYHPYGTVGNLPWQGDRDHIAFGAVPHKTELLSLIEGIKTFTEGTDPDSSEIIAIKKSMLESKTVIFLGFAFHQLNLDLLTSSSSDKSKRTMQRYFATAYGISDSNREDIETKLKSLVPSRRTAKIIMRQDLKCNELLLDYELSMSLGE